ncbi:MAG: hypothetical protein GY811_18035 [Myxococcales bacterium]|nr:hypothetical protein [Myxococcales bacterium]
MTKPTPRAEALPRVDIAMVDEERTLVAKRLHKRALKLHRAEAYEDDRYQGSCRINSPFS